MPASVVSAGIGLWNSHQDHKAQKSAQRAAARAQETSEVAARAASAAQMQTRDFSTEDTARRMRGVQATMLASRKAQNAGGGKTTLGE